MGRIDGQWCKRKHLGAINALKKHAKLDGDSPIRAKEDLVNVNADLSKAWELE